MSLNQLAVWYVYMLAPESPAYHLQFCSRITSVLSLDRLERALATVVAQSPMLRTTINSETGVPLQTVHASWRPSLRIYDSSTLSDEELLARIRDDYERPFNLAAHPGFRASVYCRGSDDHILLLTVHHAFIDGWGLSLLIDRICCAYAGEVPDRPIAEYLDFIRWQERFMRSSEARRQLSYWEAELDGVLSVLDLPVDRPRPSLQALRGDSVTFSVEQDTTSRLVHLARESNTSLFRVLLSVCHATIGCLADSDQVLIGVPVAGRSQPGFADTIGHFVNLLALRGDLRGEPSFRDLVHRTDGIVRSALANQDYPFAALIENLTFPRSAGRSPVVQVSFALQRAPIPEMPQFFLASSGERGFERKGLTFEPVGMGQQHGAFDLSLWLARSSRGLIGELKYNSDHYCRPTVERYTEILPTLLARVTKIPDMSVAELTRIGTNLFAANVEYKV
ncbi:condensation domain-containing protein [Streptomyces sp. NBC_01275]|nr:condensation domain-containing protein [Streptomyces sp. NBC_01275]